MALIVMPDPDKVASNEVQEVPGLGMFPQPVADSGRTRAEWEKLIKQTGAPLVVRDVRSDDKLDALPSEPEEEA